MSPEKLSGDRMAEVPSARCEQTRRREKLGPGPKLGKWKTILKQEQKKLTRKTKRQERSTGIWKKRKDFFCWVYQFIWFFKFPFQSMTRLFFSILLSGVLEKQHLQPS